MPLILPATWDTQPQEAVEIDWGNPLTNGLERCGAMGRDAVLGVNLVRSPSASLTARERGVEMSIVRDSDDAWTLPAGAALPDGVGAACTLFAVASADTHPHGGNGQTIRLDGRGELYFGSFGTPRIMSIMRNDGGGALVLTATVPDPYVGGQYYAVASRYGSNGTDLFIDGALRGSRNGASSLSPSDGRIIVGPGQMSGGVLCYAAWSRQLTDEEIASVSANPWQLFRGADLWHVPSAPAAGAALAGSVTLSVTATGTLRGSAAVLSGAATLALSATATLSGSKAVLAGSATLSVATTGTLRGSAAALAGAATLAVTTTGTLSGATAGLSGSATLSLSATGALTVAKPLAGSATLAVTATGALRGTTAALAGSALLSLSANGTLGPLLTGLGLLCPALTLAPRYAPRVTLRSRCT